MSIDLLQDKEIEGALQQDEESLQDQAEEEYYYPYIYSSGGYGGYGGCGGYRGYGGM